MPVVGSLAGEATVKYDEFYALPERAQSEELPLGDRWRGDGRGPWKVTWLESTGEVVAFAYGPEPSSGLGDGGPDLGSFLLGGLIELAVDHHLNRDLPGPVEILGEVDDRDRLFEVLAGWQEQEDTDDGITWLRDRLASVAE